MKKIIIKALTIISVILAFASCTVGLGEAVDLYGPEVELLTPTERSCVSENFTISGTAKDDFEIKSLTVTLDDNIWVHQNGVWTFKAKGSEEYVPFENGTWEPNKEKGFNWSLNKLTLESQGSFQIVVSCVDTSGNTSAESQKKCTVIVDKTPPMITLSSPNIKYTNYSDISSYFNNFNNYQSLQVVNNLETGAFTVSGTSNDDNTVKAVSVYIRKVNPETGASEDFIKKNLVNATLSSNLENPISLESLRSWSVQITDEDLAPLGDGKNFLEIATECSDSAGNKDSGIKSQGYILYWKNAGIPWVTLNIGQNETEKTEVYAGSSLYGNAFDNRQITNVRLTISKKNAKNAYEIVSGYKDLPVYAYNKDDEKAQTTNFEIKYPSDVADYKIEIVAKDDEGNISDTKTGYLSVMDKTFPSLSFTEIESPFGDADGNVTINFNAFDDTSVKYVKMIHATSAEMKTEYSDKNAALWNGAVTKVFENFVPTGKVEDGGILRNKYDLEYSFNLFDTLNMGFGAEKKKLSEQTFIFMVEDSQGNRSVSKFVTPADTSVPKLTFDEIHDKDSDRTDAFPIFEDDFTLKGTWDDDSYKIWGENPNGKPVISVKVRGKTVQNVTMDYNIPEVEDECDEDESNKEENDKDKIHYNGTWSCIVPKSYVMDSGSALGAFDVAVEITDIGGNTVKIQKGYQVDITKPKLEYISISESSGTYASGTEFIISLHFNRGVWLNGAGTPILNLSNGKTAELSGNYSFIDDENTPLPREIKFKYSVSNGDDCKNLAVSSINLYGVVITSKEGNTYDSESPLDKDIDKLSENDKKFNKDINILTSIPEFKKSTFIENADKKNGTLKLEFKGNVSVKGGTIVIEQENVLAPAVITKEKYNSMPEIQAYYEEGTNGADESFVPDLSTKYVLKYQYNTDDTTLISDYKKTNAHKVSINMLGEDVGVPSYDVSTDITTISVSNIKLPVKGTSYKFDIPANLVKNAADTMNTLIQGQTLSTTGVEKPVIRIYKPQQTITNASKTSIGEVTQPLSTTFKIDCETPGVTLKYSYDCLVASACDVSSDGQIWGGTASNVDNRQEEWHVKFVYNGTTYSTKKTATHSGGKPLIVPVKDGNKSRNESSYDKNSQISIGEGIDYKNGLTYQITASANGEKSYNVAYRTTLVIKNYYSDYVNKGEKSYSYWPYNNNCTVFLRGGENTEGANATAGLPCSWNINEKDKVVMMNADGTNYYFTTWNITVDKFYFQPLLGLCDSETNTDSGNKGPTHSIYQQDGIIFRIPEYPIGKGEYMTITMNGRYDFSIPGKVMKHR